MPGNPVEAFAAGCVGEHWIRKASWSLDSTKGEGLPAIPIRRTSVSAFLETHSHEPFAIDDENAREEL